MSYAIVLRVTFTYNLIGIYLARFRNIRTRSRESLSMFDDVSRRSPHEKNRKKENIIIVDSVLVRSVESEEPVTGVERRLNCDKAHISTIQSERLSCQRNAATTRVLPVETSLYLRVAHKHLSVRYTKHRIVLSGVLFQPDKNEPATGPALVSVTILDENIVMCFYL
ncbi:hypothetical protein K501DRAFT_265952 [Backusella circina FSU 941]|nr:hypothetical protein K501DRAFT_265952 [Backusella circina FSU 941]